MGGRPVGGRPVGGRPSLRLSPFMADRSPSFTFPRNVATTSARYSSTFLPFSRKRLWLLSAMSLAPS